ncbi:hypothetical protein HanPI659440_Chr17g0681911 [Helianthus annuus]|nr:hypothetical protein HanPI659440_Chr17g0681911 [Helianthus annuus]
MKSRAECTAVCLVVTGSECKVEDGNKVAGEMVPQNEPRSEEYRPNTVSEPNTHLKSSDMALTSLCIIDFSEERSFTRPSRSDDDVIEVTGATDLP